MSLEFWYMLPVGIVVTTVGMASGVGGATFYAPLFILALGLSPRVAIASGLVVEGFSFGSGVLAYVRRRLIDYDFGRAMLVATLPAALAGATLSHFVQGSALRILLGAGLIGIATTFLRGSDDSARLELNALAPQSSDPHETCLKTREGEEICYRACNRQEGRLFSGLGAFFMGLMSSGLGELSGYFLLQRCRVPSSVSVATTVFIVAITALAASAGHLIQIAHTGGANVPLMANLLVFTLPGVVIGAQLGPLLADRLPDRTLEIVVGCVFICTAVLLVAGAILF